MAFQIILKLKAAGIHALSTLVVAAISSVFVFFIWYPGNLSQVMAGGKLYGIVLSVEVVLGPLMSLVIYSETKSKKALLRDYAVVLIVQLAALAYGLYTAVSVRPVYLVFVKDRVEAVSLYDFEAKDLIELSDKGFSVAFYQQAKVICVAIPSNVEERNELLWAAGLEGKDIHLWPKYYRDCESGEIADNAKSMSVLSEKARSLKGIDVAPYEEPAGKYLWLPMMTKFGAKTVIVENESNHLIGYLDFDSF